MATRSMKGDPNRTLQDWEIYELNEEKERCLAHILDIDCKLSPENLHCDGERPAHIARRIGRQLESVRKIEIANFRMITKMLEGKAREPTFNEIWD